MKVANQWLNELDLVVNNSQHANRRVAILDIITAIQDDAIATTDNLSKYDRLRSILTEALLALHQLTMQPTNGEICMKAKMIVETHKHLLPHK